MKPRIVTIAGGIAVMLLIAFAIWLRMAPLPEGFLEGSGHHSTIIVDRNGVPLYESLSSAETRSLQLSGNDLPPALVQATIAAEDRRFFRHHGIDPLAVARAALHDLRARSFIEGGSTITQQVVKMLTPPGPRTLKAKLREAVFALRLEHRLSKRQILTLYLNLAPYGNQYIGAERASRGYFGTPASNLTAAQAAFLAGLPKRPSAFDPYRNLPQAMARKRSVLRRMRSAGLLDADSWKIASSERLRVAPSSRTSLAQHFIERIESSVQGGGVPSRIETTLDAGLQRDVESILAAHHDDLLHHGASNVAVAVLDNRSGEWLAWEGSGDYFDARSGGAIDGVTSPRQPGSALKPFTYALAFEHDFTPASLLPDVPSHFPTAEAGVLYSPRNYDGRFRGPMRARMALAGSENVPAVALLSRLEVPTLLRFLHQCGFTTFEKTASYYGLGLTLGDAEVRLDELIAAYSMFARGGTFREPLAIRAVKYRDGTQHVAERHAAERVVSPRTAFWITDILADSAAREFVFGRGGSLDFPFPVAVKTGTSQAYHDNWTVGYTHEVTVGVWVGNFDRKELRNSSGVTGAAPIFHAVMMAAKKRVIQGESIPSEGTPIVDAPAGISKVSICALSGERASLDCPIVHVEWLPDGDGLGMCTWHRRDGVAWPAEYRAWALAAGLARPRNTPIAGDAEFAASAAGRTDSSRGASGRGDHPATRALLPPPLQITSPPGGATYLIDPTLRAEFQSLPLRANVRGRPRVITWEVDGERVGTASSDHALSWNLHPGRHTIAAEDDRGHRDRSVIVVK